MSFRSIKMTLMSAVVAFLVPMMFMFGAATAADTDTATAKNAVCKGLGAVAGNEDCTENDGDANVDSVIETVINILSLVTAVIAVIMIIVGGIRYVTSSGDSSSTSNARNTIIYAVVGLVIVALAQLIVRFVVQRVTSSGSTGVTT